MRVFPCLTRDARYSAPNVLFIVAADEARARAIAIDRLNETPDHLSVQVSSDGKVIFELSRADGAGGKD